LGLLERLGKRKGDQQKPPVAETGEKKMKQVKMSDETHY